MGILWKCENLDANWNGIVPVVQFEAAQSGALFDTNILVSNNKSEIKFLPLAA